MKKKEGDWEEVFTEINRIIDYEWLLVKRKINLIGSANYPFPSVLKAQAYPFNAVPGEGSRDRRYFPCNDGINALEELGEALCRQFFDTDQEYNVSLQPYSGTQANQVVYNAVLQPGDTVISMDLKCGGHVSHNKFISKYFNLVKYGIKENDLIDYDNIEHLIKQNRPKLLIAGTSSYPQLIDYKKIGEICDKYNVMMLADVSHTSLYVATGHHPTPFKHADFVSTTCNKLIRGPKGGILIFRSKYKKKIQRSIFPVTQGCPIFSNMLSKVIMFAELLRMDLHPYQKRILNIANIFAEVFLKRGLSLYTGGTNTHLLLVNLSNSKLTGLECERRLEQKNILVNRNQIPNDNRLPHVASGIRLGVLCLATLNYEIKDAHFLAEYVVDVGFKNNERNSKELEYLFNKYQPYLNEIKITF